MNETRVLIIDNDPVQADSLERIIRDLGGTPVKAVGADSTALLPTVIALLKDQSKSPFTATVLDIIYSGEHFGGIVLWKSLDAGCTGRAGKLVIVTKADDKHIRDFAIAEAENRICFLGSWNHVRGFCQRHIFGG